MYFVYNVHVYCLWSDDDMIIYKYYRTKLDCDCNDCDVSSDKD